MRLIVFSCAAALAVAACGGATDPLSGGGGGSSTVTGTVGGAPLATTDVVGLTGIEPNTSPAMAYVGVAITNVAGTCSVLQRHGDPPNTSYLTMIVSERGSSVAPGKYPVNSATSGNVQAQVGTSNASCQTTFNESAASGTIEFDSITGAMITGSFNLTFPNGDHLVGGFNAPVCNVNIYANTGNSVCGS
jgi:hypothetical protein